MKIKLDSSYTIPIIAIVLIAGGIIFGLFPMMRSIESVQKEISNTRLDLATIQEQQKDVSRSQNEAELTKQKAELDQIFISTKDVLEFLSELEDRADRSSVEESITINDFPETNTGNIIEQPISIDATGSYENIMEYLLQIESLEYYINIDSVSITGSSAAATTTGSSESVGVPPSAHVETTRLNVSGTSFWKADL